MAGEVHIAPRFDDTQSLRSHRRRYGDAMRSQCNCRRRRQDIGRDREGQTDSVSRLSRKLESVVMEYPLSWDLWSNLVKHSTLRQNMSMGQGS
jgi:hypothetical protein